MARRFNRNQKRDRKGRWTRGGASSGSTAKASSKSTAKKPNYKTGRLSNGALLLTTKDPARYTKRGTQVGGILGGILAAPIAQPLGGAAVGVVAGAFVGNAIDRRVSRRRLDEAEAALQRAAKKKSRRG